MQTYKIWFSKFAFEYEDSLKSSTVLDHNSPFHSKTVDILIQDGKIVDISDNIILLQS